MALRGMLHCQVSLISTYVGGGGGESKTGGNQYCPNAVYQVIHNLTSVSSFMKFDGSSAIRFQETPNIHKHSAEIIGLALTGDILG